MSGIKLPKLGQGLKPTTPTSPKVPGVISPNPTSTSVSSPMKVGTSNTVKTPKSKKMPDPFGKPSLFFKNEEFGSPKKVSIQKLKAFLERKRSKH